LDFTLRQMRAACQQNPTELDEETTHFWFDYTVVRQCQKDFDLDSVRTAIKKVGLTVVEIPLLATHRSGEINKYDVLAEHTQTQSGTHYTTTEARAVYCERSFCLFELFVTLDEKVKLVVNCPDEAYLLKNSLRERPVNSASATTRNKDDKDKIDEMIIATIGFDRLNQLITRALVLR